MLHRDVMNESGLQRLRRAARGLGSVALVFSALALGSAQGAAPARPVQALSGETLEIAADKLNLELARGSLFLEGNVRARLGDLELSCPRIEVRYDSAHKVTWARGFGGIRAKQGATVATASSAEIDAGQRVVKLFGSVRLSQGAGWVTAREAALDLRTRRISLSRVEGSIPIQTVQ